MGQGGWNGKNFSGPHQKTETALEKSRANLQNREICAGSMRLDQLKAFDNIDPSTERIHLNPLRSNPSQTDNILFFVKCLDPA